MEKKKILLIGDSIRIGYDKHVKEALEPVADVYYPEDNCAFAQNVLRFMDLWKMNLGLSDDIDIVHWNAGLWDTLILFDDDILTPIDVYASFIERIYKRIKFLFPNAKQIFAYSTKVIEECFPGPGISIRYNADIEKYNEAARRVLSKYDVAFDDLYSVTKTAPTDFYSDMTHLYTEEGTKLLVSAVVKSILNELGIPFEDYKYKFTYDKITEFLGL